MLGKRRAFFFGITMSEIAFILFFAMLLFAFFRFAEDAETIHGGEVDLDECRKQIVLIQDLQKKIRAALGDPNIDEDEVIRRMVEVDRLTAELATSEELIVSLQKKISSFESIEDALAKAGLSSELPGGNATERMQRALALLEKLEFWIRHVAPPGEFEDTEDAQEFALTAAREKLAAKRPLDDIFDPNETLEEAQQRAADSHNQLQYCMDKLNECRGGGRDLPPCWVNAEDTTKIDFLLNIDIFDDGLGIRRGDEPSRQDDFLRVPGAVELIGTRVDLDKFQKHARTVYEHSDSQQCRHYVLITDRSEYSYKSTLTVEGYFYKVVNN